jgi:hypothetical protein
MKLKCIRRREEQKTNLHSKQQRHYIFTWWLQFYLFSLPIDMSFIIRMNEEEMIQGTRFNRVHVTLIQLRAQKFARHCVSTLTFFNIYYDLQCDFINDVNRPDRARNKKKTLKNNKWFNLGLCQANYIFSCPPSLLRIK